MHTLPDVISKAVTRDERDLCMAADRLWSGTSDHLLAVYLCLKSAERGGWLGAAALVKVALTTPAERGAVLRALRGKVERAKPSRTGPKMDRYNAAIVGLDGLDTIHALEDL